MWPCLLLFVVQVECETLRARVLMLEDDAKDFVSTQGKVDVSTLSTIHEALSNVVYMPSSCMPFQTV